jgi:hypothetical protein
MLIVGSFCGCDGNTIASFEAERYRRFGIVDLELLEMQRVIYGSKRKVMSLHRPPLFALKVVIMLCAMLCAGILDSRRVAQADWRQLAPWCAYQGGFGGNFDCAYYSLEQCLATARGLGNYCSPNPRAAYQLPPAPRRRRR